MNKLKFLSLIAFSIVFTGCVQKNVGGITDDATVQPGLEEKNGEISLTGKVSKSGDLYLMTTASGEVQELESYTIKLDNYVGKTASVVGEYSGNTLFITEIK